MKIKGKKILITGGSGSLGRYLIKELLKNGADNIISLSRDEGLIKEAEGEVQSNKVTWRVGDISDSGMVEKLLNGVDFVYHAAALKHVTLAEKYPREVLKINILGILNLLDHAKNVSRFINVSSDKAIGVVNCYGASKLFAEYLVAETGRMYPGKYITIRCPNLFGSRGSVLDLWKQLIKKTNVIEVTDPSMTRFFITLSDAAKFITDTSLLPNLSSEKIYYPLSDTKKFLVGDLARAFVSVFGDSKTRIKEIGARSGEKKHEDYMTEVPLLKVEELIKLLKTLK